MKKADENSPKKTMGNPNHDKVGLFAESPTSVTVDPSQDIASFAEARSWWVKNLGGKVANLSVHLGRFANEWKRAIAIQVDFPSQESHAFTEKSKDGATPNCFDNENRKQGPRTFVVGRAKLMDRIIKTIEYPQTKAVQFGSDLMFERKINGGHFVVVLTWSSARKLYVFDSSYTMDAQKVSHILRHQDASKNNGPLQKSEPLGSAPSVFRGSTESGSYPTGSKPETGESIGFCCCCPDSLIDALLFCKANVDLHAEKASFSEAGQEQGVYLGKAIRDTHESNLWLPMDSPYLADLVEAFTLQGQTNIQSFSDALASWLATHGQPQKKIALPALLMPAVPVHWTQPELDAWRGYLHAKPQAQWSPEDWSMLVEWLLQQYWSPAWASSMADWLAVKSTLLGQIEAGLAANPPSAEVAASMAAALPVALPAVVEMGLPVSALTEAMIGFARVKCSTLIVDMGERMRSGIREVVLEHQKAVMLGGKLENLQQKLFDRFATANRDWRRIAVTEVSENAAQGAVCASAPGDKMKRLEMYKGVCAWCHHINGRIVTVVAADKKNKDGFNEIWPGKTNVGRSSAPKKRVDGKLYDREPDEMWWIASGAQHPNCFVNSGVPIYTSEGYKPIGEIKIGDMVLTHKGRLKPVNWVSDRPKYSGDLVHALVSFDGKNKKHLPLTTPEHPFLTNRGWVNAGDLVAGDVIRALAKECPTCRSKFVNLRHKDVIYCRNACIPKSGINQFGTSDQDVLRVEKLKTSAANSARMAGMTVEQRRMLTAPARSVIEANGYTKLRNKSKSLISSIAKGNAALNYIPRQEEKDLVYALGQLGIVAVTQFKIQRSWRDASNRRGWWFADIALPDLKIAIEVDGDYWHRDKDRDQRRDQDIQSQGWDVIRINARDLAGCIDATAQMIARRAMNHSGEYAFVDVLVEEVVWSKSNPKTHLWNFGVEDDESYVAAGVVVHNCRGRWLPLGNADPDKLSSFLAAMKAAKGKAPGGS